MNPVFFKACAGCAEKFKTVYPIMDEVESKPGFCPWCENFFPGLSLYRAEKYAPRSNKRRSGGGERNRRYD